MPIYILIIVVQIALAVHIVKTGRPTMWLWFVIMVPLIGCLAYIIVELLPELMGGRAGRKVVKDIGNIVNPDKDIKDATLNHSITDTVENKLRLADECVNKNMFEDAKKLYKKCLSGIHANDPHVMHRLAKTEFELKNFNEVKHLLDELIAHNPDYKNADAHLLYARTAEELNDTTTALQEYEVLDEYYPGPEATYRYAVLLNNLGNSDKANPLLQKILHLSKTSGKHYNSMHKEWISLAKSEYRK